MHIGQEIFMRYERCSLLQLVFQMPCPNVKTDKRVERKEARNRQVENGGR